MEYRETVNVFHKLDQELVEWLDQEAPKRDRSRAWMINEAIRQWRKRIERERQARKLNRGKRSARAAHK